MTINDFRDSYTTSQVAKIIGVSTKTVQSWCESGVITYTKTSGGHRRISGRVLRQLIERKKFRIANVESNLKNFSPTSDSDNLKLLIVDDDENILKLYKAQIATWESPKVDVTCVSDGFNALMMLGNQHFDVLITDILMPGIDGAKMVQKVKETLNPDMTILVVSALRSGEVRSRYTLPTGVTVFEKPISFASLKDSISKLQDAALLTEES